MTHEQKTAILIELCNSLDVNVDISTMTPELELEWNNIGDVNISFNEMDSLLNVSLTIGLVETVTHKTLALLLLINTEWNKVGLSISFNQEDDRLMIFSYAGDANASVSYLRETIDNLIEKSIMLREVIKHAANERTASSSSILASDTLSGYLKI